MNPDRLRETIRAYDEYRDALCARYGRKCLTHPSGKCPMATHYCYELVSIKQLYRIYDPQSRHAILHALKELAKKEGIDLP